MAQAQYDKFIELRKSGVDALTARKQAYGDIPTTPVTPAPVAPQPTVQGVNGETFQVAPVNTQGVTPQTVPTQPVAPTTPEPVTPTPTPTQAPVDEAAKIKAQNEAQMELNKQKSQLAIQERKQQEADAKMASIPTDQKSILTSLVSGISVPEQKTQAYRNAQAQYKNYQKFNSMTPTQLLDNMKMGEIDTATSQLLAGNPSYIKAKEDFDKFQKNQSINQMMQSVTNGATGKTETVDYAQQASDSLAKKLGIDQTNHDAYTSIVSKNPDVVQYAASVKSLTSQLNTLVQERNTIYKELKAQYPDLSASAIMTLMSSRTKQATDQIDALNSSLTLTTADLKTALEMAKGEYEATSADIALQAGIAKEDRATQAQIAQEKRAKANEKPTFQQYGDKVYKVGTNGLVDTGINTASDQWQSANITRYNPLTGANESTPIFYKKKSGGAGFEAVDLAGNPIDANVLGGGVVGGGGVGVGTLPSSFTGNTQAYIASKEGFRDKAYQDSAGVWTIGYGATRINGKPVQPGQTITQADAQKLLEQDIASHSTWKTLIDGSTLSDSQKTALASFEYNLGPGIWNKSAMNIIDMIKSGDLQGAASEMKKYTNAGGKQIKGLINRRNEEASLLLSGKETGGQTFDAADTKAFENFDGKTIPAQYSKTPLLQQEFIKKYNEWRANQVNTPIKTGEDILKVQLSDKATEQEKNAIQYGSRMLNSINDLEPLELEYSKLPLKDQLYQEYIPNLLKSDNQKTLEARKKDFITAVLRKESGASIAPSEFANEEKKYFVQPGDSASVIAVKQNARNFAIKAILSAAGKDVNGKLVSSLYNPEAISPQETTNTDISSRIKAIRAKANQQ